MEAKSASFAVEEQKEDLPSSRNQCLEDLAGGWWNAKMEAGREKLAVKGGFTSTASGSKNPDMKADCWSAFSWRQISTS